MPATVNSDSPGSPRPRPLPLRAWDGFRGWTRTSQWALGIIVCGLIIIGVAIGGGSPRPIVGNGVTTITGPVQTTAPSAAGQLEPKIPLTTQAPITLPGIPDNSVAPATTPGTASGSQPPVTSPQSTAPPTTVPRPGESNDLSSTTASGSSITGGDNPSSVTNG